MNNTLREPMIDSAKGFLSADTVSALAAGNFIELVAICDDYEEDAQNVSELTFSLYKEPETSLYNNGETVKVGNYNIFIKAGSEEKKSLDDYLLTDDSGEKIDLIADLPYGSYIIRTGSEKVFRMVFKDFVNSTYTGGDGKDSYGGLAANMTAPTILYVIRPNNKPDTKIESSSDTLNIAFIDNETGAKNIGTYMWYRKFKQKSDVSTQIASWTKVSNIKLGNSSGNIEGPLFLEENVLKTMTGAVPVEKGGTGKTGFKNINTPIFYNGNTLEAKKVPTENSVVIRSGGASGSLGYASPLSMSYGGTGTKSLKAGIITSDGTALKSNATDANIGNQAPMYYTGSAFKATKTKKLFCLYPFYNKADGSGAPHVDNIQRLGLSSLNADNKTPVSGIEKSSTLIKEWAYTSARVNKDSVQAEFRKLNITRTTPYPYIFNSATFNNSSSWIVAFAREGSVYISFRLVVKEGIAPYTSYQPGTLYEKQPINGDWVGQKTVVAGLPFCAPFNISDSKNYSQIRKDKYKTNSAAKEVPHARWLSTATVFGTNGANARPCLISMGNYSYSTSTDFGRLAIEPLGSTINAGEIIVGSIVYPTQAGISNIDIETTFVAKKGTVK